MGEARRGFLPSLMDVPPLPRHHLSLYQMHYHCTIFNNWVYIICDYVCPTFFRYCHIICSIIPHRVEGIWVAAGEDPWSCNAENSSLKRTKRSLRNI